MLLKINTSPEYFKADELNSTAQQSNKATSLFNINDIDITQKHSLFTFISKLEHLDTRITQTLNSVLHRESHSASVFIKLPDFDGARSSMKVFYVKNTTDEIQLTSFNIDALYGVYGSILADYEISFTHIDDIDKFKIDIKLFDRFPHHKELIEALNTEGFGFTE